MAKVNSDQPSTSKACDPFDQVVVEDYESDEDDVLNETPIPWVVEHVYEETKEFEKVLKDKVAHYLESNLVSYPSFKWTDEVVFPNQVLVTSGNGDKVNPEKNKLVEEDNKDVRKEGFYLNQSIVENSLNKNSTTWQRQKPKRVWEVRTEKSSVVNQTKETVSKSQKTKTQVYNESDQKFVSEEGISTTKSRNKVYWKNVKEFQN